MKNIYILVVKEGYRPILITQPIFEDIVGRMKQYKHAYIFDTKKNAERTQEERYRARDERKNDDRYPEYF